jgi:hypothetical protein
VAIFDIPLLLPISDRFKIAAMNFVQHLKPKALKPIMMIGRLGATQKK